MASFSLTANMASLPFISQQLHCLQLIPHITLHTTNQNKTKQKLPINSTLSFPHFPMHLHFPFFSLSLFFFFIFSFWDDTPTP